MKLELEAMRALCELETFTINGISAEYEDFGEKYDDNRDAAEPYGCGDMCFFPKASTKEVLEKYNITEEEYKKVCEELDVLSFGSCGWCV